MKRTGLTEEELSEALGTGRYERSDERRGYRNGHEMRRITTGLGTEYLLSSELFIARFPDAG